MADHPLNVLLGRIAACDLTAQEKAVATCIARHVRWKTGAGAFLHVATIAREVGLKERQVQKYLRRLACDPVTAARACIGGEHCRHPGLLIVEAPARHHQPAIYSIRPEEFAEQAQFDETSLARGRGPQYEQMRAAAASKPRDHGQYDAYIMRG